MASAAATPASVDSPERRPPARLEVVVAGGGIAGLEALLALRALAGERVALTLIAPELDFVYGPMFVAESFSAQPAERRGLDGIADELDVRLVRDSLAAVDTGARSVALGGGGSVSYDALVVCTGARATAPFGDMASLIGAGAGLRVDDLLARAASHASRRIAFIVPPGASWPLPAYEFALMASRRARELGHEGLEAVVVTPEAAPLIMFGSVPSRRVYELLRGRGVDLLPSSYASAGDGAIAIFPGANPLDAGAVVSLPVLEGPRIEGLPQDRDGFIPIDDSARVSGCEDVFAAGDGTSFPIKQGGIAAQQADAAAERIAAELGCLDSARPFRPVLRGKLIAGGESLDMLSAVGGGEGEGRASDDYLWWPPHKVAARYLGPWLRREGVAFAVELEPPRCPIEVEVALPHEWHREPIALDPYSTLGRR